MSDDQDTVDMTVQLARRPSYTFTFNVREDETPEEAKERVRKEGVHKENADIALMESEPKWEEIDGDQTVEDFDMLLIPPESAHAVEDTLEMHGYQVEHTEVGPIVRLQEES